MSSFPRLGKTSENVVAFELRPDEEEPGVNVIDKGVRGKSW